MKKIHKNPTKSKLNLVLATVFTVITCFLTGCATSRPAPAKAYVAENYLEESTLIDFDRSTLDCVPTNTFSDLSVPTYITKVQDMYFIVDCYHNQVIYHENITDPLYKWKIMTSDLNMGHTLASDGSVYLIDDTENNRILVMEKGTNANNETIFLPTQEFLNVGNRPHYIIYDDYTDTFYAWSSQSGEMFLYRHEPDSTRMYLTGKLSIPSLNGVYVRSFTILDDRIYFVSGNSSIIEADLYSFKVLNEYPVPADMAGMIQLTKIDDYYYITVSTDAAGNQDYATLLRCRDLTDLAKNNYEDVYSNFIGGGTPYYITAIDGLWYLTEHRIPGHSVWSFAVKSNEITDVISIY